MNALQKCCGSHSQIFVDENRKFLPVNIFRIIFLGENFIKNFFISKLRKMSFSINFWADLTKKSFLQIYSIQIFPNSCSPSNILYFVRRYFLPGIFSELWVPKALDTKKLLKFSMNITLSEKNFARWSKAVFKKIFGRYLQRNPWKKFLYFYSITKKILIFST